MTRALRETTYQDNLAKEIWPEVKPQYYISETVKVYDNRVYKKVVNLPPPLPKDTGKPPRPVYLNAENLLNEVVIMPGISLEIFLSDDGGELLRMLEQNKHRILKSRNIIQVFIETDNDTLSGNVMKTLVGRMDTGGIDFEGILKPLYTNISDEDMDELLYTIRYRKGEIKKGIMKIAMATAALPARFASFQLGLAIDLIENLRISDNLWHPIKDPKKDAEESTAIEEFTQEVISYIDTALGKISSINAAVGEGLRKGMGKLSAMLQKIGDKVGKIMDMLTEFRKWMQEVISYTDIGTQMRIAFICGVWNGLVDMITGLFFIVKLMLDGISGAIKIAKELDLEMILEEMDNITEQLGNIAWGEVFGAMREQMAGLPTLMEGIAIAWEVTKETSEKVVNAIAAIPPQEWVYYIGYGLTFIIPVGAIANVLGKVGEAGKAIGKILVMLETIISKAFGMVVKLTKASYKTLATLLKKVTGTMRQGTAAVKNMFAVLCRALREWIEKQIAKVVKLSAVLIDNAAMKVECFYKMVDKGLVKVFVLRYKSRFGLFSSALTLVSMKATAFFEVAIYFATSGVRNSMRALEKHGLTILKSAEDNTWGIAYKDEIIHIGSLDELSEMAIKLFDKKTRKKALQQLDELVERAALRRKALEEFTRKLGTVADDLWKHIGGEVKPTEYFDNFGNPYYKKGAIGIHSFDEVRKGIVKIIKETIPPNPKIDEPFIARVQMKDPDIAANWVKKNNSTIRIKDKQVRDAASMFPKNWNMQRIQEEVAYAHKYMKFSTRKQRGAFLVDTYLGKSTTGFKIELIFKDGTLMSAVPKI